MTKKWVILLFVSIVTVIVWIAVEFTMGRFKETPEMIDYSSYLTPLDPTLDENSLQTILDRETEFALIERNALD